MSAIESAPPDQYSGVVIDVDELKLAAGLDAMEGFRDKLVKYDFLVGERMAEEPDLDGVSIITGNTALTVAAAMEAVKQGAQQVEIVDPYSDESISFGLDGKIRTANEISGIVQASLDSPHELPAGFKVFPAKFVDKGIKGGLTPLSMAATRGMVTKTAPDFQYDGPIGELDETSIIHFGPRDPALAVVGSSIRIAHLIKRGIINTNVEVVIGGGPRHFNRVLVACAGRLSLGDVANLKKVGLGDVAYGGGD